MSKLIIELFQPVKLLALDFDGVLTDNRVLVTEDGREGVFCSRADGMGISRLRKAGIEAIVLSTETNPVVGVRCEKLGIPYIQGTETKLIHLREIADERDLASKQICYVGNDINDLECMKWVGIPVAVADAEPPVLEAARLVTERLGGYGAVREVAELILDAQSELKSGD